jgi:short-subunit dehydrogenase
LCGEFLTHSADNYQQQLTLNISTVVALTHAFLPAMVQKGDGTIINLASMLSFFPFPYSTVYSASKAFVLSFTEGLWEEYRGKGIHFLALCPGPTDTKFFDNAKEVETAKKRTPEQVIDTAMKALGKRSSFVIDGSSNRATTLLARVLPRKTILKIFGAALRKSMQSK